MSNGIKMDKARLKSNNKEKLIKELNNEDFKNKLKCYYCYVDIVYVKRHLRREHRNPISAYLRLAPNKQHKDNCKFLVSGAVKQIVANSSKSLENNYPIFDLNNNRTYNFRLHIIHEANKILEEI